MIPPGDSYQGSKSGLALTITGPDADRRPITPQGVEKPVKEAWRRIPARGPFPVTVMLDPAVRDAIKRKLEALGIAETLAERIADKLASDTPMTTQEARLLVDALQRGMRAGQKASSLLPVDEQAVQAWIGRYGGNRDRFGGTPDDDSLSAHAVKQILAEHKTHLGIEDPHLLTARQLQQQMKSDPEMIASWNRLKPWERTLWQEYWNRQPDSPQGSGTDLALTEDARFRIAFHLSVDYLPAGAREAARVMFNDPVFQTAVMASITMYAVLLVSPDLVISKAIVTAVTAACSPCSR